MPPIELLCARAVEHRQVLIGNRFNNDLSAIEGVPDDRAAAFTELLDTAAGEGDRKRMVLRGQCRRHGCRSAGDFGVTIGRPEMRSAPGQRQVLRLKLPMRTEALADEQNGLAVLAIEGVHSASSLVVSLCISPRAVPSLEDPGRASKCRNSAPHWRRPSVQIDRDGAGSLTCRPGPWVIRRGGPVTARLGERPDLP